MEQHAVATSAGLIIVGTIEEARAAILQEMRTMCISYEQLASNMELAQSTIYRQLNNYGDVHYSRITAMMKSVGGTLYFSGPQRT